MQRTKLITLASKLLTCSIIFVLGILVGLHSYSYTQKRETISSHQSSTATSLMIDYGNGKITTYQNIPGNTIFDVLKNVTEKNNIELKYKNYGGDLGIFIESIGGIGKDPEKSRWWQYWVNNVYGTTGVSSYKVKAGDVVQFKFVKGQD